MSIKRMSAVWELSQHKGSDLLLLLAIADNAHDDGYAWPGIKYLAHKTRLSTRSVMRATKMLESNGELFVKHARWRGNKYVVTVGLSADELRQSLKQNVKADSEAISAILSLIGSCDSLSHGMCQSVTSIVTPVSHKPSRTVKEPISPSANDSKSTVTVKTEDVEDQLDSLDLDKTFEEGKLEIGDWRDNVKEWSNWGDSNVRPHSGVSVESLRRIGWTIEQRIGLHPVDGEWARWNKEMAQLYLVIDGNWDILDDAIKLGWNREPKFRPTFPAHFIKPARQLSEGEAGPRQEEGGGMVFERYNVTEERWARERAEEINDEQSS